MDLKITRAQRDSGLLGNTTMFILDARVEYTDEEKARIKKYKLGSYVVYESQRARKAMEKGMAASADVNMSADARNAAGLVSGMARGFINAAKYKLSLRVTVDSLAKGHHIECKDMDELIGAEDAMKDACASTRMYLETAKTFDGEEEVFEF